MTDPQLDEIRARAAAATGDAWHWAGNTDTGEPYLAAWISGAGRCQVLAIGQDTRDSSGLEAERLRSEMREAGYSEEFVEEEVEHWAAGRDPRLKFMTDLMLVNARDHVVFEVSRGATSREDPSVYRADIVDIRHPDADFIAHSRTDIDWLLKEVDRLSAALAEHATVTAG